MYEVRGWWKFSEEDRYGEGCDPTTSRSYRDRDMHFTAETIDQMIDTLMSFVGCRDRNNVTLDACDEEGRVDIVSFERADGDPATDQNIKLWKEGDCRLWHVEYSFRVEKVERHPVRLREETVVCIM